MDNIMIKSILFSFFIFISIRGYSNELQASDCICAVFKNCEFKILNGYTGNTCIIKRETLTENDLNASRSLLQHIPIVDEQTLNNWQSIIKTKLISQKCCTEPEIKTIKIGIVLNLINDTRKKAILEAKIPEKAILNSDLSEDTIKTIMNNTGNTTLKNLCLQILSLLDLVKKIK